MPPDELDGLVLARLVTHEVRWVGKHFLSTDRLERLTAIRDRYVGRDPYLDAFLDCLLDKHEGRFWNRTYLALPVLEVLLAEHDLVPSGVAAMLAADIVRYELCAAHRLTEVSPVGRPDSRTLRTRMRHSLRFMTAHLGSAEAEGAALRHRPRARVGPSRPSCCRCRRRRSRSRGSGSSSACNRCRPSMTSTSSCVSCRRTRWRSPG